MTTAFTPGPTPNSVRAADGKVLTPPAVLANPKHEWHEEFVRLQGPFDPQAFDAEKATKAMRKVR